MKKRGKAVTRRTSRTQKTRRALKKNGTSKSKSKSRTTQATRARAAGKRRKTARYKARKTFTVKIQSGPKEPIRYERKITKFRAGRGRKQRLTPKGVSKIKSLVKRARSKRHKGKRFTEQVSVKVTYMGRNGKIKTRWENFTSQDPSMIDDFIQSLDHGITYTQYFPDETGKNGEPKTKVHRLDGRGTVQELTYEKILELPNA